MITVITKVVYPNKEFLSKEDFKSFMVQNFVPESDPLREYNFKLMDKYGHCFFNLVFEKPNIGILYHRYHTKQEYEGSIKLRHMQQSYLRNNGIQYDYKLTQGMYKHLPFMHEKDYENLHTKNLQPTNIKIDVDLFLFEIEKYKKFFKHWGDKFHEFGRYGLPLINTNGAIDNDKEPSCWPLDRWNFVNLGYKDTPEDFTKFYTSSFDMGNMVNETDFTIPTEVMNLSSLKPLEKIKKYMIRSCILKFHTLAHFKPHIDTWKDKSSWLRLWGTTHPETVKLRYKSEGEKLVWNDIKKEYESYIPERNIEAGRLYLHDSSIWHDAMSFEDNTYQFFIALNIESSQWIPFKS